MHGGKEIGYDDVVELTKKGRDTMLILTQLTAFGSK
jgi:hypothetical protein